MYQFDAAQQTGRAKLAAFFPKFKKTVQALWVNETKINSRNTFIDNLFALESEKDSKNDETTLLRNWPQILDFFINTECYIYTVFWAFLI